MTEVVVAADAEQLLVGVIRSGAMVAIRSCVDITLVHDSAFIRTPPYGGIHSHAHSNPLGWGNTVSISRGDAEGDVVLSAVANEAIGSGG
jgi:hypothetical protein